MVGVGKDLLDRQGEGGGETIGEIERRIVALRLERIDRLARDVDHIGEMLLGPAPLGAKHAQPALHGREVRTSGVTIPKAPQKSG